MADDIEIRLGRRLKAVREGAGLTQAELAALTMKSVETISNFERGKTLPSVRTLAFFADRLDCAIADFFSFAEPTSRSEDPFSTSLVHKFKLLNERDRTLLAGIIDLLINQPQELP